MKRYIHYASILLIIASISAGILSVINSMTKPIITSNSIEAINEARKEVLPLANNFTGEPLKIDNFKFVPGKKDGRIIGYVVAISEPGYSGNIDYVIGIDNDGIITGLNIINNTETPGLGSKITNLFWKSSWKGRGIDYEFDKSIDAFAGATISPFAVYTGIQRALKAYEEVKNEK